MEINTPSFGTVELNDFIELSKGTLRSILHMRNHSDVRMQMHNNSPISEDEHFNFVDSLKTDKSKKYFAVSSSNKIVGVIYFTDINLSESTTTFGIYANLIDKIPRSGSILMEAAITYFNNYIPCNALTLEVYESNERAVNLYLKYGFIEKRIFKKDSKSVVFMELGK